MSIPDTTPTIYESYDVATTQHCGARDDRSKQMEEVGRRAQTPNISAETKICHHIQNGPDPFYGLLGSPDMGWRMQSRLKWGTEECDHEKKQEG